MMRELVAKEFRLVAHPTTWFMIPLGLLTLVPSWPYAVILIWGSMPLFFNCQAARENCDIDYSMILPVSRDQIVAARTWLIGAIELAMVAFMGIGALLRPVLGVPDTEFVGMRPTLSFLGLCLIVFGVLNCVFLAMYWRNPAKVGIPFLVASAIAGVLAIAIEVLPYVSGLFGGPLNQMGAANMGPKAVVFAVGAVVFAAGTWLGTRIGQRRFAVAEV